MQYCALVLLLCSMLAFAENDHDDQNAMPLAQLEQQLITYYQPDTLKRQQQLWIDNQQQQADGLLAAQPRLLGEVKNDQLGKDLGYQNMTLGLVLPLWWPNERALLLKTNEYLATWQKTQLAAQRQELRLNLYQATEAYVSARESLHHATLAVEHAQDLLSHVQARMLAGDLSQFDLISAKADWQQRQQDLLFAEQTLTEKQLAFFQLTHQMTLPQLNEHPVAFEHTFDPKRNARIFNKHSMVSLISAQLNHAETVSTAKPELTIASEQDKADRFSASNQLTRLSLSIPLGVSAHRAQAASQLGYELSQAKIELAITQREIGAQWAQYTARFAQNHRQYQQQQSLNETMDKQYKLAQAAFRSGELDLRELLRIKSAWLEGQHTEELLKYGQIFSALALKALQEDTGL